MVAKRPANRGDGLNLAQILEIRSLCNRFATVAYAPCTRESHLMHAPCARYRIGIVSDPIASGDPRSTEVVAA